MKIIKQGKPELQVIETMYEKNVRDVIVNFVLTSMKHIVETLYMITACMFGVRGVGTKFKNIFKRKILICCKCNGSEIGESEMDKFIKFYKQERMK